MNKYQYDDQYFLANEADIFIHFENYEEEEAFAHYLIYGKH